MTLYEFNSLSEVKQYHTVFTTGTYLDSVEELTRTFVVYAIDRFFVEITYAGDSNKIIALKSFKEGKLLDKYSKEILL